MVSIGSWCVEVRVVKAIRLVHDHLVVALIIHGLLCLLMLVLVLVALALICRVMLKVAFVVLVRRLSLGEATGHSAGREALVLVLDAASFVESSSARLSYGVTLSAVVVNA